MMRPPCQEHNEFNELKFILYYLFYKRQIKVDSNPELRNMVQREKKLIIDFVVLWVDGNDPEHQKKLRKELELDKTTSSSILPNRFRDCEELKYCLRSVGKYLPWINKIWIVTDGQKPAWLLETEKVRVISHDEFMDSSDLPTFNSEAIEANLWRINELAEHFLLASDDCFCNAPLTPKFFFDASGNPIVRLVKIARKVDLDNDVYINNVIFSNQLINERFGTNFNYEPIHNIEPLKKSRLKECCDEFKEEFRKTSRSKFRKRGSVQRVIFNLYTLVKDKIRVVEIENNGKNKYEILYLSNADISNLEKKIKNPKNKLFCVNDEPWVSYFEYKKIEPLLNRKFPTPENWESFDYLSLDTRNLKNNAIVWCTDEKYLFYTLTSIASFIRTQGRNGFEVFIFNDGFKDENLFILELFEKEYQIKINLIDAKRIFLNLFPFANLKAKNYWSECMYYKCLIPLVFKNFSGKVLYVDSDTIFDTEVKELFEIKTEKWISACIDSVVPDLNDDTSRRNYILNTLNLENPSEYFNSGVVLFNMKNINLCYYKKRLNELLANRVNFLFPDQDILNIIFKNNIYYLDFNFNFQLGAFSSNCCLEFVISKFTKKTEEKTLTIKPCIIHFSGKEKPWNDPNMLLAYKFWNQARELPNFYGFIYSILSVNNAKLINKERKIRSSKLFYLCNKVSLIFFPLGSKRREILKNYFYKLFRS